ncbi:MAG: tryptophan--tRNA ligase [Clostridia bacterium]|nr:tryptophan--tRNA ligase [Clostridia bacterium]MBR3839122.1 tryptophan--tRNA ligase [Clostridia bacterium]
MMDKKKRIFSGIQPSGNLTIGNYLGALKRFPELQSEYDCLYCVVDLHTLTVRQDPEALRQRSYALLALYMACGLDPEQTTLFLQSHVSGHAELAWILNCYTYMGELSRMTQFKDKSQKHADNINAGLFTYPVLMAADILLYQTDVVPIGQDQKQHLEIARDIAIRFNKLYGDTFVVPEALIAKQGAKIMSLQEPDKKMSKSDTNVNNFVLLIEERDAIIKKFKRAVTDSGSEVRFDPDEKPGISNLLSIYAATRSITVEEAQAEFAGSRYGDFKIAVGTAVADMLAPIQAEYRRILDDKAYLDRVLKLNAQKAFAIAEETYRDVRQKVGFIV